MDKIHSLSTHTQALLDLFDRQANKGHLHELDLNRWYEFAISVYKSNETIPLDKLQYWLETHNFPKHSVSQLIDHYDVVQKTLRLSANYD
jgi:hypothetical protein